MSVYSDVLTSVISLINSLDLYADAVIGALPPNDGISVAWTTSNNNLFFDKKSAVEMVALVNAKNKDQKTALDALSTIHTRLNFMRSYPAADNYQITNIETSSSPSYMGREENNQWLYGSSLRVKFYLRGN